MSSFDARPAFRDVPVLVLGASGFLGRWVAHELARAGARVHLAVRDARALEPLRARWNLDGSVHELDLSAPGSVSALVAAIRPRAVFNLAGYGVDRGERQDELFERLNAALPAELCDALDALGAPATLVHTGSALEYGTLDTHLGEEEVERPTTPYGCSKLAGTQALCQRAARQAGVRLCVARLFTVYGPGEHAGRLLPSLAAAAQRGERVALSQGLQQRDFTYVEDVVEGLLRLAARLLQGAPLALDARPVVNLATGVLHSVRQFALEAAAPLGLAPERLDFGALPERSDDMQHLAVSVERARAWLGWIPSTGIAAGVRRGLAFERERLERSPQRALPPPSA